MRELDRKPLSDADQDVLPLGIRTVYEKAIGESQREKRIYKAERFAANLFVAFAAEKPISRI